MSVIRCRLKPEYIIGHLWTTMAYSLANYLIVNFQPDESIQQKRDNIH